jgi:FkbM family methyltransferase
MSEPFTSYAQNGEDVFIERCFGTRKSGFYIDIGASHPVKDNPTYSSYCKGWSGVNLEPIAERVAELLRLRPRDITIQAAVGASNGEAVFYRTDGIGGLSSCVPNAVMQLEESGSAVDRLVVPMLTLDWLCAQYGIADVQVLKIDVEGYEGEVLNGFSFNSCRPELLIIEAVSPAGCANAEPWVKRLLSLGYDQVYDDALNLFFVRQESCDLKAQFLKPLSVIDGVRWFSSQGSCFSRTDHPDHAWAVNFMGSIIRHISTLSVEETLMILTRDISGAALAMAVDLDAINRAFYLVLGRWVTPEEAEPLLKRAARDDLVLKSLIFELLNSREFIQRVARSAASI